MQATFFLRTHTQKQGLAKRKRKPTTFHLYDKRFRTTAQDLKEWEQQIHTIMLLSQVE